MDGHDDGLQEFIDQVNQEYEHVHCDFGACA